MKFEKEGKVLANQPEKGGCTKLLIFQKVLNRFWKSAMLWDFCCYQAGGKTLPYFNYTLKTYSDRVRLHAVYIMPNNDKTGTYLSMIRCTDILAWLWQHWYAYCVFEED